MKPAPHGRYAIPRGTDGGPKGDARSGSGRGAVVAKKSAAPCLRNPSAAFAGGAVALGAYRDRRPKPFEISYSNAPTKVLVLGGEFGGLAAVRGLARAFGGSRDVRVALLDRVNYTTFWPMVPAAILGNIEVLHVARSIRRILKPLGAEFFQADVVGVDFDAREVRFDVERRLPLRTGL
jgi:hypothetical protein